LRSQKNVYKTNFVRITKALFAVQWLIRECTSCGRYLWCSSENECDFYVVDTFAA